MAHEGYPLIACDRCVSEAVHDTLCTLYLRYLRKCDPSDEDAAIMRKLVEKAKRGE
jgi:hypothetical protein